MFISVLGIKFFDVWFLPKSEFDQSSLKTDFTINLCHSIGIYSFWMFIGFDDTKYLTISFCFCIILRHEKSKRLQL